MTASNRLISSRGNAPEGTLPPTIAIASVLILRQPAYLQTTFLSFFDPQSNKSVVLDPGGSLFTAGTSPRAKLEESNYEQKREIIGVHQREIRVKKTYLIQIHAARLAVRDTALPVAQRGAEAAPLAAMLAATPAKRTFRLLAQGDSWFDYPPGTDLVDCSTGITGTRLSISPLLARP